MLAVGKVASKGVEKKLEHLVFVNLLHLRQKSENPCIQLIRIERGLKRLQGAAYVPAKEELTFRGVVRKNYGLALLVIAGPPCPPRHILVFRNRKWPSVLADKLLF